MSPFARSLSLLVTGVLSVYFFFAVLTLNSGADNPADHAVLGGMKVILGMFIVLFLLIAIAGSAEKQRGEREAAERADADQARRHEPGS